VLPEKFRDIGGTLSFHGPSVQLPLELPDVLSRVAQRPELLQLIDDLLHFLVNHVRVSFSGVSHKKPRSASTGGIVVSGDTVPQY
jgi:hypothetical protein